MAASPISSRSSRATPVRHVGDGSCPYLFGSVPSSKALAKFLAVSTTHAGDFRRSSSATTPVSILPKATPPRHF